MTKDHVAQGRCSAVRTQLRQPSRRPQWRWILPVIIRATTTILVLTTAIPTSSARVAMAVAVVAGTFLGRSSCGNQATPRRRGDDNHHHGKRFFDGSPPTTLTTQTRPTVTGGLVVRPGRPQRPLQHCVGHRFLASGHPSKFNHHDEPERYQNDSCIRHDSQMLHKPVRAPVCSNIRHHNYTDHTQSPSASSILPFRRPHPRRQFLLQSLLSMTSMPATTVSAAPVAAVAAQPVPRHNTTPLERHSLSPPPPPPTTTTTLVHGWSRPFSSTRQSRVVTLTNGLEVLLVSDRTHLSSTTLGHRDPLTPFRLHSSPGSDTSGSPSLASVALTVGGAGQFNDPSDLPGLAHLMEHIILSYNFPPNRRPKTSPSDHDQQRGVIGRPQGTTSTNPALSSHDFEEWISERDGESNAFTAYDYVCFHFVCPPRALSDGLERFARLFREENLVHVCQSADIVRREIRRVDAELDFDSEVEQVMYLTKAFCNPEHPYAKFSRGSKETLEGIPQAAGIDVGERLLEFFRATYQPTAGRLVVISPDDLSTLERWVEPFSTTLSLSRGREAGQRFFPGGFLVGNRPKHLVLYREIPTLLGVEKMVYEWPLDLDYRDIRDHYNPTATEIAFVLAQILGRRGPGSLYRFLLRRGWITDSLNSFVHVTIPLDVSGFQIIRLELSLTRDGAMNRSAVVASVCDSIESLRGMNNFLIPRALISQYVNMAALHGYWLSPRPSDAVELAVDAQMYRLDEEDEVGSGKWYRFVSSNNNVGIAKLQQAVARTLKMMSDPLNAIIVTTLSGSLLSSTAWGMFHDAPPKESSSKWIVEPISRAQFFYDDILGIPARIEELVLTSMIDREELFRPVVNPLFPTSLFQHNNQVELPQQENPPSLLWQASMRTDAQYNSFGGSSKSQIELIWRIMKRSPDKPGLPMPIVAPEPNVHCAFVIQFLSPRPARANVREAAHAELWKRSFEVAVSDIAELGAPCGLAYDVSFNSFGLRLAFLGLSSNMPSYVRRISRRFAQHHVELAKGPIRLSSSIVRSAIFEAKRARGISTQRRLRIISNLRAASREDVVKAALLFFLSCTGLGCYAEGNIDDRVIFDLQVALSEVFRGVIIENSQSAAATPPLDAILYRPAWKPHYGSSCSIAGMPLVSDACGRTPR